MQFMNVNVQKATFKPMIITSQFPIRFFALPDHVKLEMPNLSPTMEKVRKIMLTLLG